MAGVTHHCIANVHINSSVTAKPRYWEPDFMAPQYVAWFRTQTSSSTIQRLDRGIT